MPLPPPPAAGCCDTATAAGAVPFACALSIHAGRVLPRPRPCEDIPSKGVGGGCTATEGCNEVKPSRAAAAASATAITDCAGAAGGCANTTGAAPDGPFACARSIQAGIVRPRPRPREEVSWEGTGGGCATEDGSGGSADICGCAAATPGGPLLACSFSIHAGIVLPRPRPSEVVPKSGAGTGADDCIAGGG